MTDRDGGGLECGGGEGLGLRDGGGSGLVVVGVVHRLPRGDLGQLLARAPQLPRNLA